MTASEAGRDPYKSLGVRRDASDAELRAAYRRLVRLHHPDHNGGSIESTRRFEEVQEAYARIVELRRQSSPRARPAEQPRQSPPRGSPAEQPPKRAADPDLDARVASMERDLREAQLQRERARRAAREAAAQRFERPSDEQLGYVSTDDSFSKIFADAADELSKLFFEARERHKPRP